jgi:mRNA interferase YafQ
MKRELIQTSRFCRSYKRFVSRNEVLRLNVDAALRQLSDDPFIPPMRVHKLDGNLFGLYACSCGYDCRIVFAIEVIDSGEVEKVEVVVLYDVGTHDDMY